MLHRFCETARCANTPGQLRPRRGAAGLWVAALLLVGCGNPSRNAGNRPSADDSVITNTDPCAMRLHDICGPLLMHYATHHRLPARIEELGRMPGFESIHDFTCPASHQPYVYNPDGILRAENGSRVILYDPSPSHSRMRWAVSILEPADSSPLVTKVIAYPESSFPATTRPAQSAAP